MRPHRRIGQMAYAGPTPLHSWAVSAPFRMAELLGGLSLACDLANGNPPEKAIRTVVLAVEVGRRTGAPHPDLRDAYYVNLLRYLGCTAFAHEESARYGAGDDIAVRRTMAMADVTDPVGTLGRIVRGIGPGAAAVERVRAVARLVGDGVAMTRHAHAQCEASIRLAEVMGVGPGVTSALGFICERWDGRGAPGRVAGEALPLAMRLHHLADQVELAFHRDGREAAIALARRRSGGALDPALARAFLRDADELLDTIDQPTVWERFLALEPGAPYSLPPERIDDVARAFAAFADLKSGYTLGHSTGVARLAEAAATGAGHPDEERAQLRRAALLHDLGKVSVANTVWDKPGRLNVAEWERVRLHAYWTERALWQAPPLRPLAQLAGGSHERLDGAGYHRALPGAMLARAGRLLAAADAYHAMTEPRPHRPAMTPEQAARTLLDDVTAGRIDRDAAHAVLDAAGQPAARATGGWPAGLTDREVEVLRHVARGASNKQVAVALDISAKTVQHHVAHVYAKIGCASRAAAALFAIEHGLL
jgi:HD-GYP domain-containing protein (c-di-GMP phosphodiesterase class II)